MTGYINTEYGSIVRYNYNTDTAFELFEKVLDYYKQLDIYSGEGLYQSDNAHIDAIQLVSDIADDILEFTEHDN